MSGPWLFVKARRTATAVLVLLGLALVERILGSASLRLSENSSLSIPWVVIVPLVAGTVIGLSTRSTAAHWELFSARHQAAYRIAHTVTLCLVGAVSTAWGSNPLIGPLTTQGALRNLAGFTGLALIAAVAIGGNLAWTLPLAVGLASLTAGTSQGSPRGWAWPIQPDSNTAATLVALILLAVGMAAVTAKSPPEPAGEAA